MTLIKKMGSSAHAVANGKEALAALEEASYDLVLMDCQMPEMDGFEATRRIRELEARGSSHLCIVALTANAMKEDQEQCFQAGMDNYLSKPIKKELLAQTLHKWLILRRGTVDSVILQVRQ